MVQPNIRLYPVAYISKALYSTYQNKLKELGKQKKTDISFNFEKQYFLITGRSQLACDETCLVIEESLLPRLNRALDDDKMAGTFGEIDSMTEESTPSSSCSTPEQKFTGGKIFNLDQHLESKQSTSNFYCEYDSETEEEEGSTEFVETFSFAKNVQNPKDVLTGPVGPNNQPIEYLRVVGQETDTECSLIDRTIKIVGKTESDVKDALERFRNLQTFYKRRKRDTNVVACVHMTSGVSEFGLYFCNLDRYAQQGIVAILNHSTTPLFVILPVFKNSSGNFQKPRELLEMPRWSQKQEISLEDRMRMASLDFKNKSYGNQSAGLAPDQRPLWGESQPYVTHLSESRKKPTRPTPPVQQQVDDFPALMSAPKVLPKKPTSTRRVMKIVNQKSSSVSSRSKSFQDSVKDYNFHNIKSALEDGLDAVRGFRGEIKISAKLGKVLWSRVTPEIQKQIWNFTDLQDSLMREQNVKPHFNNVTTLSDDVISRMSEVLPSPFNKTAYFEIHAKARHQPILPYQPVVMYINQGIVEFKKIVTSVQTVTEIDWVSLGRKFDFRLSLNTEQTTRTDVKPYSTFLKKVSISPVSRQITYENIPDFLEVDYILLRQTTKYRIHFPFVVEITRVERIPLIKQRENGFGIEKILGDTGKGDAWYDLEVYYTTFEEIFKGNLDLPAGKVASWKVENVLGEVNDKALYEYIRCLLLLVEKCEKALT